MSPALYGLRARHRVSRPSLCITRFLTIFFFFQACFFKVHPQSTLFVQIAKIHSFARVKPAEPATKSLMLLPAISLEYCPLSPPPIIPYAAEQSPGSRLTRPFVVSFKLASNHWISRAIIRCNLAAWRLQCIVQCYVITSLRRIKNSTCCL